MPSMVIFQKTADLFRMVKFSHSVFALPFALGAMLAAARGFPGWRLTALIIAAMVTARSAAMAFNRLADAGMDAKNPRTASRHLPRGLLSRKTVLIFLLINILLFEIVCHRINPLAFALSPLVLAWLLGYSLAKRFTWLTHLWLGVGLGLSPLGAWVAVTGAWPWPALWLGTAVLFWVGGFDILYAAQDADFDRKSGLHSMVTRFGIAGALRVSRLFHFLSAAGFAAFGLSQDFGMFYFTAVFLMALGLLTEQSLVKDNDLSRVNTAFFTVNGLIGLLFLAGMVLETL